MNLFSNKVKLKTALIPILSLFTIIFYIANRLWIFTKSSAPFRYDTGLYRGHFLHFINSLPDFPIDQLAKNEPPLLYVLADILHLFDFSVDSILIGWYVVFALSLAAILFLYLKLSKNIFIGIAGLFLYTISLTQFEAYWYLLYKNIIAFIITLICLYFIQKKSYWAILFGAALFGFHYMSFFIFAGAIFFEALSNWKSKRYYFQSLLAMVILGLLCYLKNINAIIHYLPWNLGQVSNLLNLDSTQKSGTFWSLSEYLYYSVYYLPFAFWGWIDKIKNKKFDTVFWYFTLCSVIIVSQFFFYRRFIIHFDFIAIILAAPMIVYFFNIIRSREKIIPQLIFFGWIVFLLVRIMMFSATTQPLLSDTELQAVGNLKELPDNATIIAGNSAIAPWVYGYSEKNTIWPGKFANDIWNKKEWQTFRTTDRPGERYELLNQLPKPLYIYLAQNQESLGKKFLQDKAFKSVSSGLWEYIGI